MKESKTLKALIALHDYVETIYADEYPKHLADQVREAIKAEGISPDWETVEKE